MAESALEASRGVEQTARLHQDVIRSMVARRIVEGRFSAFSQAEVSSAFRSAIFLSKSLQSQGQPAQAHDVIWTSHQLSGADHVSHDPADSLESADTMIQEQAGEPKGVNATLPSCLPAQYTSAIHGAPSNISAENSFHTQLAVSQISQPVSMRLHQSLSHREPRFGAF